MAGAARIGRLRWLCRRWMKELDVLLERFVASSEQQLREGHWPEFEPFLQHEDDVLWDSLRGVPDCVDSRFDGLISAIRNERGPRP